MKFIRFDPNDGLVVSIGDMEERYIDEMLSQGDYIRKTPDLEIQLGHYRLLLPPCGIPPLPEGMTLNYNMFPLISTEYYPVTRPEESVILEAANGQIAAVMSVAAQKIDDPQWLIYNNELEVARQTLMGNTSDQIISVLPVADPTGKDWFRNLRQFANTTANTA